MKLATLCYIKDNDNILMIHRVKREGDIFKDFWNGIGGKMGDNESPEECVICEVREETGLTIKNPTLRGLLTFPNNRDTGETWYVFVYVATEFHGTLIETEEGDLEWIPEDTLHDLNIQEADKIFLKWINQNKIFSAKFHYIGTELKDHQVYFY